MKKYFFLFLIFSFIATILKAQTVEKLITGIKKYRFENPDSCILLSEKAIALLEKKPDFLQSAIIYNSYATTYYGLGNYKSSDSLFEIGLTFAQKAKSDTLQIFINNNRGLLRSAYDSFESSMECFMNALRVAKKSKIYREIADTYNNIASLYNYYETPDSAIIHYQNALEAIKKETERPYMAKIGLADIHSNLGQVYFKQGKLKQAFENLFSSLKIFEQNKLWEKAAITATVIAEAYFDRFELTKAKKYALIALKYDQKQTRAQTKGNVYFVLGKIAQESHINDTAFYYYDKAIKTYEEFNLDYELPIVYNSLGALYETENILSKAEYYFQKAINLNLDYGDQVALSINYMNVARVYLKKKEYSTAKTYIDKAIVILSPELNYSMFVDAYGTASETYKYLGDFKRAFEYLHIHSVYKDSLRNENNTKAQEEIEAIYQNEKKQKELERQNAINEKKSLELKLSEEQGQAKSFQLKLVLIGGILLLLAMIFVVRSNIQRRKTNQLLEQKNDIIYKQNAEVILQSEELKNKNHIIEEKQKEILDSINYAKRIQYTLLANDELMKKNLSNHFVFFQPKDIVSGDFYWATYHNHSFYLAICDSTGHGVPGAFMSLLNISFLSEAINEKNIEQPGEILNYVRKKLIDNISQEGGQDGMDGILMKFKSNGEVSYAAAHNAPLLIRENETINLSFDKMPIGKSLKNTPFQTFDLTTKKGDCLYLFTDGYPDQFGGDKGKKLKHKNLVSLIKENHHLPLPDQKIKLENTFNEWKGGFEQIDDVLLAGIKF